MFIHLAPTEPFFIRRRRTKTIMNRTSLLGSRASVTSSQQSASQFRLKKGCLSVD